MVKNFVIGVCGLIIVGAFSFPAFADQSIGYQHYFNEGVKAFKEHDDQKAIRCFKVAQIYDPSDPELIQYLNVLAQKGVIFISPAPDLTKEMEAYEYYLTGALKAAQVHDDKKAIRYLKIAKIFYPASKDVDGYLKILYQRQKAGVPVENQPVLVQVAPAPAAHAQPAAVTQAAVQENLAPNVSTTSAHAPSNVLFVPVPKPKGPTAILSLALITNNGQIKPKLQIELHSSVIIEGKNIQKFLVVDEGFISVKIIGPDRLEIDAQKIGITFLHIWDEFGLHTLYVEVIFPSSLNSNGLSGANSPVQHGQPFKVIYTNDYDTEYSGKNIPAIKRQSYNFNQTLTVSGDTPYGFFDTTGSYTDINSISSFDYYTVGLSQIPVEGTSNFNLRGLDATRYLSPLTMPNTSLKGAFADVDLLDDLLGLSFSHGQEQVIQGFFTQGQAPKAPDSYIDAAKITLLPTSKNDQYSFNFATGYGSGRGVYEANHVYSVEGLHRFNDNLTLNAEHASDASDNAELASLKWEDTNFRSGIHFRNLDKNYETISDLPEYQGETGADWTTEGHFKNITENTFVEAYRDHINFNPDNPSALNYDANGQLRVDLARDLWNDLDFNYMDSAGEASPQTSLGLNDRVTKGFGIWNSLQGDVFIGTGYQFSHSKTTNLTDYNRENIITGFQVPLTSQLTFNSSYEYDWYDQPHSGGNSTAGIINAGLSYQKLINQQLSFNTSVDYHDELGVNANNNNFLSGEESVIVSSGLNYSPSPDVNIFGDLVVSKDLYHTNNPSLDDIGVHVGMRITFGGATYWDPLGTVTGVVFKDRNGDGKYEKNDEGIQGVTVKVGDKEGVTDKNGRYRVQIRGKTVDVVPVLDTIPGGLLFSTPQFLNVPVYQGRSIHADFGLISQTGIYGLIFISKRGTNTPSEGDKFVGKVKVVLDGKIIQQSDGNGAYYFRKVTPGQHTISIDINSIPLNMVPLIKLKNMIDVGEGVNYPFNIPLKVTKSEGGEE